MGESPKRDVVAPSLDDLSYAHVKQSQFFGLSDLSGKAMSFLALGTLGPGMLGLAQFVGIAGAMAGVTVSLPVAVGALGVSFASGLAGWWVGGFDDRAIDDHNSNTFRSSSTARRMEGEKLQDTFIKAVSKAEYDPAKASLPYDALGRAVVMSDEQIEKLPAHIQFDVYRTQMDLDLYKYEQLCSHQIYEAMVYEARVLAKDATMEEKATAFKENRDNIRELLEEGSIEFTPIGAAAAKKPWGERLSEFMDDVGEAMGDSDGSSSSYNYGSGWGRSSRGNSGGGIFGGGGSSSSSSTSSPGSIGGSFGGANDGFKTGGTIPAAGGFITGGGFGSDNSGNYASFSGSGSGSRKSDSGGFKSGDIKIDGAAAQGLVIVAGVAAVCAAGIATGFSIHKNFFTKADEPLIDGVTMPYLAKALPSREAEIRQMYGALSL